MDPSDKEFFEAIGMPQGITATALLVGWANGQDAWLRRLTLEVIATGRPLSATQMDVIYQTFLVEKALAPGDPVTVPLLSDDSSLADAGSPLTLVRLSELKNVNALTAGQGIEFNPKLTVVFGENACGKTGYVRVLKKAAAVRTTENVIPDVTQPRRPSEPPSARITYKLGSADPQTVDWKDESGLAPLNRIDVFDSRATLLHVDGDLNYVYTPSELARFPLVRDGIDAVRTRLERDVNSRAAAGNPFLVQFDRQSRIYPLIDSLGASTDLAQLRTLAVVTESDKQESGTLRTEIEALQTTNPAAQLKLAEGTTSTLNALLEAVEAIGGFNIPKYTGSLDRLQRARHQYEGATQMSFAGMPIPRLLKEEWRRFIQAGEDYLKTLEAQEQFPAEGKECLYCRQPLSPEAVALLRKYRDYCNNELRVELDGATHELDAIRQEFERQVDFADMEKWVADAKSIGASFNESQLSTIAGFIERGRAILGAIDGSKSLEWQDRATETGAVRKVLEDAQTQAASLVLDLTERRDKREQALHGRQAKLLDIESRSRLAALLPQIGTAVEQAKWVDKAKIQQRKFQGLLRSVTDTSKVASEQLLNRDFERYFMEESKRLKAPAVTLQFPGRQGQVTRKKAVASGEYRPSDVLSEGEQKVIALADFLAETSLKPPAPVIFDDPINSLDYKRMADVVTRLVFLSETRQVIVFTHNIWFTTELLGRFEDHPQDCSYFDVARDGTRIGIVSKGTHPRSDTLSSLRGRINSLIQPAEKATGEVQAALIEKGYELLRSYCEVFVEQELLQGVTQRYQPNVAMTRLQNINFARLEAAVAATNAIFEDSCRYIASHSQPMETLNVRPTLDTLKADWKKLQETREAYLKKS
jgi:AAA domain